jgi:phosphonate transport system substrate-binding protein
MNADTDPIGGVSCVRAPPVLNVAAACPGMLRLTALVDLAPILIQVLILAFGLCTPTARAEQVIRFAPLPLEDPKIVHEQFGGLVDYLQEQTGVEIRWVALRDNAEIVRQFRASAIDLAYLGPLPYVILARDHPAARPLCCFRDADGETAYTCSLIMVADSGLSLERLKGVRFGLTQPYSTCGYLASSQMLATAGLSLTGDGNSFSYAGNHSAAALGVAQGKYDVAGVKTSIAGRYRHLGLDVIATSPPYPGFSLVANAATLDEPTIERLQEVVLRLDRTRHPELAGRMQAWGEQIRNGTVPHGHCDFSGVAAALTGLPWPIPEGSP